MLLSTDSTKLYQRGRDYRLYYKKFFVRLGGDQFRIGLHLTLDKVEIDSEGSCSSMLLT